MTKSKIQRNDDGYQFRSKFLIQAMVIGFMVSVGFILGGLYMIFTKVNFQGYAHARGVGSRLVVINGPILISLGIFCLIMLYFLNRGFNSKNRGEDV